MRLAVGRVEGRRVAGRASVALPALSRRAAVRTRPPTRPAAGGDTVNALDRSAAARTCTPGPSGRDDVRLDVGAGDGRAGSRAGWRPPPRRQRRARPRRPSPASTPTAQPGRWKVAVGASTSARQTSADGGRRSGGLPDRAVAPSAPAPPRRLRRRHSTHRGAADPRHVRGLSPLSSS